MNCPIDKDNLSLSFLFSLFLKYETFYFKDELNDIDISIHHIPILLKLLNHEYIYQKDICVDLRMDNGLLTRTLRKLEDEGYIKREEDNDNRRQNKISLTEKGKELAIEIKNKSRKREETIMKDCNVSRDELIDLLLEILENSKKYNKNEE